MCNDFTVWASHSTISIPELQFNQKINEWPFSWNERIGLVMVGQGINGLVIMEHNALTGYGTMRLRPHRNRCPKLEVGSLKSQQTR